MAENEDSKLSATSEAAKGKGPPKRRSRAFGKGLLAKLPTLGVSQWEATDTLNVYQDMQGVVDLDADAFLQPLEPLAEERHE